jgi:hypothetical protein
MVTVEGEILDHEGKRIHDYHGMLEPEVYDKPSAIRTLGQDPKSFPADFSLQKDCLYRGNVSVDSGTFGFTFLIPKDIFYEYGFGKISYYSNNELVDASGYFDNLLVGGLDENVNDDHQGPEIALFLNDEQYIEGDVVHPNPLLIIYLEDENGINALGNGIGHDITLSMDGQDENKTILNDYFEYDINSYQRGEIQYPLYNLPEGVHTVSIKAWDLLNNSSTAITEFMVSDNIKLAVGNLLNYPNPVVEGTSFTFDHNQYDANLEVELQLFDIQGRLVNILGPYEILSTGYQPEPIYWDGHDNGGNLLSTGIYIYKLKISNNKEAYSELSGKLIIFR